MFKQFDVFRHPNGGRGEHPFLVCLQSDIAHVANTVVIAPLVPAGGMSALSLRVFPLVLLDEGAFRVLIPQLAAVPRGVLKSYVCNISRERASLLAALDLLFTGI